MTEIEQFKTRFYDIDLSISDDGSYNMPFARLLFEGWQACAESKQAELDKANAHIARLKEALQWYIETDKTYEGGEWEDKNEFWLNGKRKAQKLLSEI